MNSSARTLTRRKALIRTGLGLCGLSAVGTLRLAPARAAEKLPLRNRFPRMMQRYYVDQVRRAQQRADERRAAMTCKADAKAYVDSVRARIAECFGPMPERTDLDARVTGTLERDTYRVEKVIFQSRPGFLVTGNLYVPKQRGFPLPGVIGTCGHSHNGKCDKTYQSFAQGLARLGYVVLVYDPIGQGERLQYPNARLESDVGVGVREHLLAGNQQFLVDEFLGAWRAWDGIRALDYLLSREEVDPTHIGVTGNSGGGTMTTWLAGVERRWTMAAPSCFVTTFCRNMENELPADTEQCPPKALALELDHSDFLAAMAPRPVILLAQKEDFFDIRGTLEAYGRLKRLYSLLGAEENIAVHVSPGPHGYSQSGREAMYRWFNRATGISDSTEEPALAIENDKDLWCTPNGQVCELDSRPVYSFTREKSQALAGKRTKLSGERLKRAVRDCLRLSLIDGPPPFRVVPGRGWKPSHPTYAVETEPGVFAVVTMQSDHQNQAPPPLQSGRALLYVAHRSSYQEMVQEPLIGEVCEAEPEATLIACDVRGVGESQPDTCGRNQFLSAHGSDYFYAIHAIMLDRPYIGRKTHDVLCVINWIRALGFEGIHLLGKGWGALPATFAALLSDHVDRVTLKHAPASYSAIAESRRYDWPLSTLLPGVLTRFDLPDCYATLEAKSLRQIERWPTEYERLSCGTASTGRLSPQSLEGVVGSDAADCHSQTWVGEMSEVNPKVKA